MKYQKQDKRINKSKNAITNALLKLMKEKSLSEITVSELTKTADINRKTFYNHYDSIDAVLKELEQNCTTWVLSFAKDQSFEALIEEPATIYTEIAKGLLRHKDLLQLLFDAGVYSDLSNNISATIKATIMKKAEGKFTPEFYPRARLILDFITAGAVGTYDRLFEENPATIEEITDTFESIFDRSNVKEFLKEGLSD